MIAYYEITERNVFMIVVVEWKKKMWKKTNKKRSLGQSRLNLSGS